MLGSKKEDKAEKKAAKKEDKAPKAAKVEAPKVDEMVNYPRYATKSDRLLNKWIARAEALKHKKAVDTMRAELKRRGL